ncbi:DDE superfamily endonuclease [Phytophthora infestans]|uniref:DDE superfamily endonuclease n=1 Tax=Phytophthora infestans TaxID=4787 RepID=A0A8S9UNQ0_PHYIN|nr:DDE superfamily endonuclease [Phytophthora infestans]
MHQPTEDEVEEDMMLLLALELLIDDSSDDDDPAPADKIPRLLGMTSENGERPFEAIYNSRNRSLFRDHFRFRMSRSSFDVLFDRCARFFPETIRDQREALGNVGVDGNLTWSWRFDGASTRVPSKFKTKFSYFDQAICAIDDAHFPITVARADCDRFRSRKGWISTNVLVVSDWSMRVCFAYVGAEGSAHDETVMDWSKLIAMVPEDIFVLADAGYGLTEKVLTPFRSTRYHLKEWAKRSNGRPETPQELFNLRHAKARNIVERLIGILKRRFRVLRSGMECEFPTTKSVIYACMLLHNFIRAVDASDQAQDLSQVPRFVGTERDRQAQQTNSDEAPPQDADSPQEHVDDAERIQFDFSNGTAWRSWMAQAMWDEYVEFQRPPKEASSGESDYATSEDGQGDEDRDSDDQEEDL